MIKVNFYIHLQWTVKFKIHKSCTASSQFMKLNLNFCVELGQACIMSHSVSDVYVMCLYENLWPSESKKCEMIWADEIMENDLRRTFNSRRDLFEISSIFKGNSIWLLLNGVDDDTHLWNACLKSALNLANSSVIEPNCFSVISASADTIGLLEIWKF